MTITARADDLGDRMKDLEMQEAGRKALPGIPLIARLDGRAFHTFTRQMKRPYDTLMVAAMEKTTKMLVQEFKPIIGYTQSDEITLVFPNPETLFGGRFQKLHSTLAGYASAVFARIALVNSVNRAFNWPRSVPSFDCRVWQVPSLVTALDVLIWREDDATKNSVAMLAQSKFSHKDLQNKGRGDMLDMLKGTGVMWNDQPTHFKRGIYVKHRVVQRPLTGHERLAIPEAHRPAEGTLVNRGEVYVLDLPPIRGIDREEAINRLFFKDPVPEVVP